MVAISNYNLSWFRMANISKKSVTYWDFCRENARAQIFSLFKEKHTCPVASKAAAACPPDTTSSSQDGLLQSLEGRPHPAPFVPQYASILCFAPGRRFFFFRITDAINEQSFVFLLGAAFSPSAAAKHQHRTPSDGNKQQQLDQAGKHLGLPLFALGQGQQISTALSGFVSPRQNFCFCFDNTRHVTLRNFKK